MTEAERRCVVCREGAPKRELVRLSAMLVDGGWELALDPAQRLPGRGVYCHGNSKCFGDPRLGQLCANSLGRSVRTAQRAIRIASTEAMLTKAAQEFALEEAILLRLEQLRTLLKARPQQAPLRVRL